MTTIEINKQILYSLCQHVDVLTCSQAVAHQHTPMPKTQNTDANTNKQECTYIHMTAQTHIQSYNNTQMSTHTHTHHAQQFTETDTIQLGIVSHFFNPNTQRQANMRVCKYVGLHIYSTWKHKDPHLYPYGDIQMYIFTHMQYIDRFTYTGHTHIHQHTDVYTC